MKRRKFIQTGSLVTLPLLLRGVEITAISRSSLQELINPDSDKVLVLIQLNGGNDGLNTLIPLDQYDNLVKARENIILPESSVLKLTDEQGLNPAMTGMHNLYKEGKLGIVQSVAYPDQNRSHFRSTDIWTTASDSDEYLTTGWLGRHFDLYYPGYPEGYPNEDYPDPFAITLGYIVSETCQGTQTNFSYAVANENSIIDLVETEPGETDNTCYGMELSYVKEVIKQSNAYSSVVREAFDKAENLVEYPNTRLSAQLRIVANLIAGGLKTKVFVVSIGGFDTHANQVVGGSPLEGRHSELLEDLSSSIDAFQKDITAHGVEERVIGMTFSEFGRRIRSNDGFGTDHGTAAPLFVFGHCVEGGVFGENPEIADEVAVNEGVAMQYDFRSIYASVLIDFFDADEGHVRDVLFEDFQKIPFLKDCNVATSTEETDGQIIQAALLPNTSADRTVLLFYSDGGRTVVQIFDSLGSLLQTHMDRSIESGEHRMELDFSAYASGPYFVRLLEGNRQKTLRFIKL